MECIAGNRTEHSKATGSVSISLNILLQHAEHDSLRSVMPFSPREIKVALAHNRVLTTVAVLVLAPLLSFPAFAGDGPAVSVPGGQVRGIALKGGGAVFKGIPYGQTPVGELRWKPPAAVKPWSGVRDAGEFGGAAHRTRSGHAQGHQRGLPLLERLDAGMAGGRTEAGDGVDSWWWECSEIGE